MLGRGDCIGFSLREDSLMREAWDCCRGGEMWTARLLTRQHRLGEKDGGELGLKLWGESVHDRCPPFAGVSIETR